MAKYRNRETVEAFLVTQATAVGSDARASWPQWMKAAFKREPETEGSLFFEPVNDAQPVPRLRIARAGEHSVVPWGYYLVRTDRRVGSQGETAEVLTVAAPNAFVAKFELES